ncbi:MAG: hypothetical protein JWM11_862, partial [Planctomycetaceae bacterium]|nr:hypothetical protein [Planctomycetaceae bacterium]
VAKVDKPWAYYQIRSEPPPISGGIATKIPHGVALGAKKSNLAESQGI